MKNIILQKHLADLKAKIHFWLKTNYNKKYYSRIKKRIFSYLNLCNQFYIEQITLNKLIKIHFKGAKNTFYNWSNKILKAYLNNDFNILLYKYQKPNKLNYQYNLKIQQKICDLYYSYQNIQAGGIWSLFNNLKMGFHNGKNIEVPKNIKTFYRWIKSDPRWYEIKEQIKKTKRHFKKYEVSEIGLLQMDAKIITTTNFPVDKKYYIYDFIDEKTRIVFGYVYDNLGVENSINAVKRAIFDFNKLGIKIKRIRTDNGTEFITSAKHKNMKIKERPFTTFLFKNKIMHETTPIRSPQSNGKIERFHQHYNKLFYFKYKKFNQIQLQNYLNEYYYFYNFERCHLSLKNKTHFQALKKTITYL